MDVDIYELMQKHERLDTASLEHLRAAVEQYPYYHAARLLMLRNLFRLHDSSFGEELSKAALFVPDRTLLFQIVEADNYMVEHVPIEETERDESKDRATSLIDRFLDTTIKPEETHKANVKIDSATDYIGYMLQSKGNAAELNTGEKPARSKSDRFVNGTTDQTELIESFISLPNEQRKLSEEPTYTPEMHMRVDGDRDTEDEGYFTETLAKIYIKQERYEKAIEIISKLSLNYREKNSYFADQLRFLQKIVINNKYKK